MSAALILHDADDVAIATEPTGDIPAGHKVARHDIQSGAAVHKFGQIIGFATDDISAGDHVHVHNLAFGDHGEAGDIGRHLASAKAAIPSVAPRTFDGYLRYDGRVGTRNMIALLATVNCSATVIRHAAEQITRSGMLEALSLIHI